MTPAATAAVLDTTGHPQVDGSDRRLADQMFFGPHDGGVGAGTVHADRDIGRLLGSLVASGEFSYRVVRRALSSRSAFADAVPAPVLEWALKRLPLTAQGSQALSGVATRSALLGVVFSDPAFLETVCGPLDLAWSPSVFLPASKVTPDLRGFIEGLIDHDSTLIDARWMRAWGLRDTDDAESLARYGALPFFRANALFDPDWYARQAGVVFHNYFDALQHYVEQGESLGLSPNPFFNIKTFSKSNPDLIAGLQVIGAVSMLAHVLEKDTREFRSSCLHFDAKFYSGQVDLADLDRHNRNLFSHYVSTGWADGLQPNPCFDQIWYLRTHADARQALAKGRFPNAFSHFVQVGEAAGHRPNALFDPKAYALHNSDLAADPSLSPFHHFWRSGRFETRNPGTPSALVVARNFPARWPDSSDVWTPSGWVRTGQRPEDVLDQIEPAAGMTAIDILAEAPTSERVGARDALRSLSKRLARPRILLERGTEHQIHAEDFCRLYVSGFAALPSLPLRDIRVTHDGARVNSSFFRYARVDEADSVAVLRSDPDDLKSGFMLWFDFSAADYGIGRSTFSLSFVFGDKEDGGERVGREVVFVDVLARPAVTPSKARIQVAMASYAPPAKPFARQIESILVDTRADVVISDDATPPHRTAGLSQYGRAARVHIDRNLKNAGFVGNFERSLYMCSASADVILFSDQDDAWHPDKIETLLAELVPGVSCAFSDMRIVTGDGHVISNTFWSGRSVHHFDAMTVGVANTVTGAASAFRRDLLSVLTPFPRYLDVYHDQWLSVIAAAAGRIAYVDRPLYDYIQHGANVLGFSGSRSGGAARWRYIVRSLRRARRTGVARPRDVGFVELALLEHINLLQRFVLWNEALLRLPVWSEDAVRRVAEEACRAMRGEPFDVLFLRRQWGRLARRAGGVDGLLNIDDMFECVLLARHLMAKGVVTAQRLVTQRDAGLLRENTYNALLRSPDRNYFEVKLDPIRLSSSGPDMPTTPALAAARSAAPMRVNLFIPELKLGTFFGGYHSKISLLSRLEESGVATRLLLVDQPAIEHDGLARIIGAFPELEKGLDRTEIVAMGTRMDAIDLGPRDVLVATTWWSAQLVDEIRRSLGRERFLYFIQEFEPFTFPPGTWYRAAERTYDFPHDAIFSTEILRDFFAHSRVGVFGDRALPDAATLAFRNPITGLREIPRVPLAERRPRLLFYARPQGHAARNMYEFGLAALRIVAERLGDELEGWDIVGVGADANAALPLNARHFLRLISKLDSFSYREMLANSDVGLALMYTPHPSLVPIEMAAAGLVTVTNACMTKDAASFRPISDLIHVPDPEIEAIAEALMAAVRQVQAGVVVNRPLDWPTTPAAAFPDAWIAEFSALAERSLSASAM